MHLDEKKIREAEYCIGKGGVQLVVLRDVCVRARAQCEFAREVSL